MDGKKERSFLKETTNVPKVSWVRLRDCLLSSPANDLKPTSNAFNHFVNGEASAMGTYLPRRGRRAGYWRRPSASYSYTSFGAAPVSIKYNFVRFSLTRFGIQSFLRRLSAVRTPSDRRNKRQMMAAALASYDSSAAAGSRQKQTTRSWNHSTNRRFYLFCV